MGVVGVGNIGSRVARKWRAAFSARVIGYDPYVEQEKMACEKAATLEELLRASDLVTLHVPLTNETQERSALWVARQAVDFLQGKPPLPENRVA